MSKRTKILVMDLEETAARNDCAVLTVTTARLDITVGLLERYLSMLYVLQMALGDPPHPEQSVSKVDFGAVPTDGLGVHRQYH
jgi:hypothetical protein